MSILSASQIAYYARAAGFQGQGLQTAIAIALAESGGNTLAYNPEIAAGTPPGSGSRGLWQIYGKAHPQYNSDATYDPMTNARAAFAISGSGTNFQPWSTYTNGAYRQYLAVAATAAGNPVNTGPGGTPISGTVDSVFTSKGLWKWYNQNNGYGTNPFNGITEKGIDYATTYGTPVGIIVGGTVARIVPHNNSINDVVEITDGKGGAYLYQHITASVRVGQLVSTGDVVGRENGLPVDQYSTGPHIEVRYTPHWNGSIDSWLQPWVNPYALFSRAGNLPATGSGGVSGVPIGLPPGGVQPGPIGTPLTGPPGGLFPGGIGGIPPIPLATYVPTSKQVHETLINTPGFYGIALALDEAEQFVGWVDLTAPQHPVNVPGTNISTGITPPDIVGIIRSVAVTVSDNAIAGAIRFSLMGLGFLLMIALVIKPLSQVVQTAAPFAEAAA